jgi:hypothetical protein
MSTDLSSAPSLTSRPSKRTWDAIRVYIVYLDDSTTKDAAHQVIAAVIVHDADYTALEKFLANTIEDYVPDDIITRAEEKFEFHASDIWNGVNLYEGIKPSEAAQIFTEIVSYIVSLKIQIIYGSVDTIQFKKSLYSTTNAKDLAFRICLAAVEEWLKKIEPNQLCIVICDDFPDPKLKGIFQHTFREYRLPVRTFLGDRGRWEHFHDSMYFGNSMDSFGIQTADFCAFLIQRHLAGKTDTEPYYQLLAMNIANYRSEPSIQLPG